MSNFKTVYFFNFFHKGDLHLSRMLVKKVIDLNAKFRYGYAHNSESYILNDLRLAHKRPKGVISSASANGIIRDDTLYLNTWYNSQQNKYFHHQGICFDALYDLFNSHCKLYLGGSLEDISKDPMDFYPQIDFKYFKTDKIDNYIIKNKNIKVLLANGNSLSGQSVNFSFSPIINKLSEKYKDVTFIYTNRVNDIIKRTNVIFSGDIIGHSLPCDLNENAYLSKFCDLLVGRSSGVYTYCMIRDNMMNNKKRMLSFSSIGKDDNKYWLGPRMSSKIKYECTINNYNIKNYDDGLIKVEENIRCLLR